MPLELLQDSGLSSVTIGPHWPSSYPEYLSPFQDKDEQQRVVWARLLSLRPNLAGRLAETKARYLALRQDLNPRTTQVESSHDPLYRDIAVSDPWLASLATEAFAQGRVSPAQVVRDLQSLVRVLHPPRVLGQHPAGTMCREPSSLLVDNFRAIFDVPMSAAPPNIVVQLADWDVLTHSFVLRTHSPFFEDFFADGDWTSNRWEADGTLHVDLRHLDWH